MTDSDFSGKFPFGRQNGLCILYFKLLQLLVVAKDNNMLCVAGNEITSFTCLGKSLFLRFMGEKVLDQGRPPTI